MTTNRLRSLILLVAAAPFFAHAEFMSWGKLNELADADTRLQRAQSRPGDLEKAAKLVAYVWGVHDGLEADRVCINQPMTSGQLVEFAKTALASHKGSSHDSPGMVIAISLTRAYPCKK